MCRCIFMLVKIYQRCVNHMFDFFCAYFWPTRMMYRYMLDNRDFQDLDLHGKILLYDGWIDYIKSCLDNFQIMLCIENPRYHPLVFLLSHIKNLPNWNFSYRECRVKKLSECESEKILLRALVFGSYHNLI